MALIECYECKKSISSEASACIHCGAPMAEQTAHAQAQAVAQIKIERDAMEGVLAHQRGAHARQLTLAQFAEALELALLLSEGLHDLHRAKHFRHDHADAGHSLTKEI